MIRFVSWWRTLVSEIFLREDRKTDGALLRWQGIKLGPFFRPVFGEHFPVIDSGKAFWIERVIDSKFRGVRHLHEAICVAPDCAARVIAIEVLTAAVGFFFDRRVGMSTSALG